MIKNKNSKSMFLASFFLILSLSLAFFIYKFVTHKPDTPKKRFFENSKTYYDMNPSFHPLWATKLKWNFKKNSPQIFQRDEKNEFWSQNQKIHQSVYQRLLLLSQIHFEAQEKINSPLIQFEVSFKDNSTWSGQWDGEVVVWTSGPHKNKGTQLLDKDVELLLNAEFWKPTQELSLCSRQIFGLKFMVRELFTLFVDKNQWFIYDSNGKKLENLNGFGASQIFIGQLCGIKIDNVLENSIAKIKSETDFLEMTFGGNEKIFFKVLSLENNDKLYFSYKEKNNTVLFSSQTMEQFYKFAKEKTLKDLN